MSEHPELERISAAVHADWMEGKLSQGVTSRCGADGEEYMVPYAQLSEAGKELDRATVRAVLKHLPALAPAPASSSGAEAGEVYLLEDDIGNLLSVHRSEDVAQKAAQAMMDKDARRNKMHHRDIVWRRKKAIKKHGQPALLLGDMGPEGFFGFVIYSMPVTPAPALAGAE